MRGATRRIENWRSHARDRSICTRGTFAHDPSRSSAGKCSCQRETVTSAKIGNDGLVHIRRGDGTEFVAPREISPVLLTDSDNMQVSVEQPVLAEDGRTVGWTVNFPNCCTSYPIPLMLVIYRDGGIFRRIIPGLAVFRWFFLRNGSEVAYSAETVHGSLAPTCELRDVRSGGLLDEWHGDKRKALPKWAELFAQDAGDVSRTTTK